MEKITIELKGNVKKGDLLEFDGTCFHPISKNQLLGKLELEIKNLQCELEDLKNQNANIVAQVNEKLKTYHNILQNLTKEN